MANVSASERLAHHVVEHARTWLPSERRLIRWPVSSFGSAPSSASDDGLA